MEETRAPGRARRVAVNEDQRRRSCGAVYSEPAPSARSVPGAVSWQPLGAGGGGDAARVRGVQAAAIEEESLGRIWPCLVGPKSEAGTKVRKTWELNPGHLGSTVAEVTVPLPGLSLETAICLPRV